MNKLFFHYIISYYTFSGKEVQSSSKKIFSEPLDNVIKAISDAF